MFPAIYQHLLLTVKPERDQNPDPKLRKEWWMFRRSSEELRSSLAGLERYTATVETAKHRIFQFLEADILPDNKLVVIALDDAFHLGVLSSRVHLVYSSPDAAGALLESRPVYVKSRCFDPFPFPLCGETEKKRIRKLAEELDAHRKRVQAQHGLTLTGLYNVLEKLRAGEALNATEKLIHDQGLVSVLRQLHDDLDAAVFAAYGWPATLTDAEILERLVALNAERAKEESNGVIRWLRPEYQARGQRAEGREQKELSLPEGKTKARKTAHPPLGTPKLNWPKTMAERVKAISVALGSYKEPVTPETLAQRFKRADPATVAEILETLCTMGHAHRGKEKGSYLS
jgi:hypothetical protein